MKLAEIKPQVFENVTFYTTNFFGIGRVDCKSLEIREGYDYAQYPNAVHVQFLEKGKRKPKAIVISSLPFFILVDTKHAIKPDDWMNHNADGSGESKYASFDKRYQTDFRAKLEAAGTPIIKDYANWNAYQIYKQCDRCDSLKGLSVSQDDNLCIDCQKKFTTLGESK